MLFYNDIYTIENEKTKHWFDNVEYLLKKHEITKESEPIFLKLSTTIWYCLTLEGIDLFFEVKDRNWLMKLLCNCFEFFEAKFIKSDTCQWVFGYMMEVRPDLFLSTNFDYNFIEQKGQQLIKLSANSGNIFAKVFNNTAVSKKSMLFKNKKEIEHRITECFDKSSIVDNYFVEMISMNFVDVI